LDILDANDTFKRPISLLKHLYLICQANFRDPKLHFATLFGIATHSLRSPALCSDSQSIKAKTV